MDAEEALVAGLVADFAPLPQAAGIAACECVGVIAAGSLLCSVEARSYKVTGKKEE
jgi:hypothetical protein